MPANFLFLPFASRKRRQPEECFSFFLFRESPPTLPSTAKGIRPPYYGAERIPLFSFPYTGRDMFGLLVPLNTRLSFSLIPPPLLPPHPDKARSACLPFPIPPLHPELEANVTFSLLPSPSGGKAGALSSPQFRRNPLYARREPQAWRKRPLSSLGTLD